MHTWNIGACQFETKSSRLRGDFVLMDHAEKSAVIQEMMRWRPESFIIPER
jgi:hypothetical protein